MEPDRALPGGVGSILDPVRPGSEVLVHAVDRSRGLGSMLEQSRIFDLGVVVVVELPVDEVSEVSRVVGQVELLEELHEVLEVQNDRVVLKQKVGKKDELVH